VSGVKLGGHESDLTIPECGLAMIHYAVTSRVSTVTTTIIRTPLTKFSQRSTTYKPMRSGTSAVLSTRQSTRSYKYSRRNSEPESTPHPCLHRMHLGCAQRRSSLPRAAS
jgi:hypothetical protein